MVFTIKIFGFFFLPHHHPHEILYSPNDSWLIKNKIGSSVNNTNKNSLAHALIEFMF